MLDPEAALGGDMRVKALHAHPLPRVLPSRGDRTERRRCRPDRKRRKTAHEGQRERPRLHPTPTDYSRKKSALTQTDNTRLGDATGRPLVSVAGHRTEAAGCVSPRSEHSPGESNTARSRELMSTLAGQNRREQKGHPEREQWPDSMLQSKTITTKTSNTSTWRHRLAQNPGTDPSQHKDLGLDENCHCGKTFNSYKFQRDQELKYNNVFIII